jgi:hypothetical protein
MKRRNFLPAVILVFFLESHLFLLLNIFLALLRLHWTFNWTAESDCLSTVENYLFKALQCVFLAIFSLPCFSIFNEIRKSYYQTSESIVGLQALNHQMEMVESDVQSRMKWAATTNHDIIKTLEEFVDYRKVSFRTK